MMLSIMPIVSILSIAAAEPILSRLTANRTRSRRLSAPSLSRRHSALRIAHHLHIVIVPIECIGSVLATVVIGAISLAVGRGGSSEIVPVRHFGRSGKGSFALPVSAEHDQHEPAHDAHAHPDTPRNHKRPMIGQRQLQRRCVRVSVARTGPIRRSQRRLGNHGIARRRGCDGPRRR